MIPLLAGLAPVTALRVAFGRLLVALVLGLGLVLPATGPSPAATGDIADVPGPDDLARWLAGFRSRALAEGIRPDVFDRAFQGVSINPDVIRRDRNQAEFTRAVWDYLDRAVSDQRISDGRRAERQNRRDLRRISRAYGVEAHVLLAIWGLESNFGANRGNIPIVEALSTLAVEGRRRGFAERELIAVLRILQTGVITPREMLGSWAGAMGHTQFMPTSYLAYAADGTGNGRADIWGNNPADALASAANYLKRHGWQSGQPWGVEVALPQGFDFALADGERRAVAYWRQAGLRRVDGGALADHGPARLIAPTGARGPVFLTYANFDVIRRYNNAISYALAIGHLADRINGGAPFRAAWPRGDTPLNRAGIESLQGALRARGFDPGSVDGIDGPRTRAAIRAWQAAAGMVPDGYPSQALLEQVMRN